MDSLRAAIEYVGWPVASLLHGAMQYLVMPTSTSETAPLSMREHLDWLDKPGLSLNLVLVGQDAWGNPPVGVNTTALPDIMEMILLVRRTVFGPAPCGGWSIARVGVVMLPAAQVGELAIDPPNFDLVDDVTHDSVGPQQGSVSINSKIKEFRRIDVYFFRSWDMEEAGLSGGALCSDHAALPAFSWDDFGFTDIRRPVLRLNRNSTACARTLAHELGHFIGWLLHETDENLMTVSGKSASLQVKKWQADDFLDSVCAWYTTPSCGFPCAIMLSHLVQRTFAPRWSEPSAGRRGLVERCVGPPRKYVACSPSLSNLGGSSYECPRCQIARSTWCAARAAYLRSEPGRRIAIPWDCSTHAALSFAPQDPGGPAA